MTPKDLLKKAIKDFYGEGKPDKEVPSKIKKNMLDEQYLDSLSGGRKSHLKRPGNKKKAL